MNLQTLPLRRVASIAAFAVATVFTASAALAQEDAPKKIDSTGGKSPHETFSKVFKIGRVADRITITYGRPFSKDPNTGEIRKIWGGLIGGSDANPWGQPWRAGSDEATLLITQKPIILGGTPVPAGAYTLFLVPYEDGSAKLVVNKQIGEWGIPYGRQGLAKTELARIDMTRASLDDNVDEFTIALANNPDGGGFLQMKWEKTQYSVPFTVEAPPAQ